MTQPSKIDFSHVGCCGTVEHLIGPKGLSFDGDPPQVNNPVVCGTTGADAIVRQAIMVACIAWAREGLSDATPLQVFMYDEGNGVTDAFAYLNNIIAVDRRYRDERFAIAGNPKYTKESRRSAMADFGALMIHERGHNLGLGHVSDAGNIMYGGTLQVHPPDAVRWAELWIP